MLQRSDLAPQKTNAVLKYARGVGKRSALLVATALALAPQLSLAQSLEII